MITKEYFFQFMQHIHKFLWSVKRPDDEEDTQLILDIIHDYILLVAGMDNDIASYFSEYLCTHDELDDEQLDMMFDYFTSYEKILN